MKRVNESKIFRILEEPKGDITVHDLCRKNQMTERTFYRLLNKFSGKELSDIRRLKALERENGELKQIVADLTLDNRVLRDVYKKW